jgi:hypothetical protein
MYKPSMYKKKKLWKKAKLGQGSDRKDMEVRFASAGPNKQMYEMYNMS